jgi:hypothetical protein
MTCILGSSPQSIVAADRRHPPRVINLVVKRGIARFAASLADSPSDSLGSRVEHSRPDKYVAMSNVRRFPLPTLLAERFAGAIKTATSRTVAVIS